MVEKNPNPTKKAATVKKKPTPKKRLEVKTSKPPKSTAKPKTLKELSKIVREIEEDIRGKKNEFAVGIDKFGVVKYKHTSGIGDEVSIKDIEMGLSVLTHNHPEYPVSFTEKDMGAAVTYNVGELRVCNKYADFSLKPSRNGWTPWHHLSYDLQGLKIYYRAVEYYKSLEEKYAEMRVKLYANAFLKKMQHPDSVSEKRKTKLMADICRYLDCLRTDECVKHMAKTYKWRYKKTTYKKLEIPSL